MSEGIPCLWMRGGTSKGAYFLARDLPVGRAAIDDLLLRIMGSPDARQIDGIGGADPLTSKVAILSPSSRADADVDYLFLQVFVDQALVSDAQGCGNILAGVGPAAIERGLIAAQDEQTPVRIHMINTGEVAVAHVATPGGVVSYDGPARIDGVPGSHAGVPLMFSGLAGSMTGGAMLPTGHAVDQINGVACTLIDMGMPIVVMDAADFGLSGQGDPPHRGADDGLGRRQFEKRAEDDAGLTGHGGRRDFHAQLHPPSLSCHHRRFRRCQCCGGLCLARRARCKAGPPARRWRLSHRTPHGYSRSDADARRGRCGCSRRYAAHRAQADGWLGLSGARAP
jgi:2-methylaconitate cis-trans-isomerase PrpF